MTGRNSRNLALAQISWLNGLETKFILNTFSIKKKLFEIDQLLYCVPGYCF
jgi:hypothetical protein